MFDIERRMPEPLGYLNVIYVNDCDFIDEHCTGTFAPSYPLARTK